MSNKVENFSPLEIQALKNQVIYEKIPQKMIIKNDHVNEQNQENDAPEN